MSFEEISLVIPFIELGYDYGIEDFNAPQPGCIRGFKTHKSMDFSARVEGTKCIYVCRNPLHVRFKALNVDLRQNTCDLRLLVHDVVQLQKIVMKTLSVLQ